MATLLFVTTGLSLLTNPDDRVRKALQEGLPADLSLVLWNKKAWTDAPGVPARVSDHLSRSGDLARNIRRLYEDHVIPGWPRPPLRGCAELDTLVALTKANPRLLAPDTQVRVLGSDTPIGEFCSKAIAEAIPLLWTLVKSGNVRQETVKGLDGGKPAEFASKGVAELARIVRASVDEIQPTDIHMDLSGGFKATLPVMTLLALPLGARMHYLFEFSTTLVSLPPFHARVDSIGPVSPAYHGFLNVLEKLYPTPPRS